MNDRLRNKVVILVVAFQLILIGCQSEPPIELPENPEIIWDEWGTPHIFAAQLEGISYAWGWAQARNHGPLLVELLGEARGRGSEYWGPELIEQDSWIRLVGIPQRAQEWYSEQSPEAKSCLEAFVAGINDYLTRNLEELSQASRTVLPILPTDVLGHLNRVIHFRFVSNVPALIRRLASALNPAAGSNAWAVAPNAMRENAMLLINPHLPWSDFYTWMEGHFVTQGMNFYGAALIGSPFMALGFNEYLGWTHTVNTIDAVDLYQLELQDDGYLWDGEVRAFEGWREVLKVVQNDGTLTEHVLDLKSSVHGPVIQAGETTAIAMRVSGLDRSQMFQQYLDMARSKNLAEFEEVFARLQMPVFTLIYADREGHILSLFGGVIPRRPAGDWNWSGVVPGHTSQTLWKETHVYGELPRVLDPATGWVQNANEPPWTTTLPYALKRADFPSYMAPQRMGFRPQASVRLLSENPATLEDLVVKANSSRMELAERVMDDLLPILADGDDVHKSAGQILEAWDRTADAGSRGSVLFAEFWARLRRLSDGPRRRAAVGSAVPFSVPWNPARPDVTPDGLAAPALVRKAIAEATETLLERYGALDVPWGDVYRLRRGGLDFPASGGSGGLGIFRVVGYAPAPDNRRASVAGDSFMAAVEFRKDGPRAYVLTVYGNSSKPDSIHYGDQLQLFAQKQMRPALLTREAAMEKKFKVEELTY